MNINYTKNEIDLAQAHLDRYTVNSSFWDTENGQQTMRIARQHGLESTTSNYARSRVHAVAVAMERQGWSD